VLPKTIVILLCLLFGVGCFFFIFSFFLGALLIEKKKRQKMKKRGGGMEFVYDCKAFTQKKKISRSLLWVLFLVFTKWDYDLYIFFSHLISCFLRHILPPLDNFLSVEFAVDDAIRGVKCKGRTGRICSD